MARFCARIGYSGRVPASVLVERVRANLLTASDGNVAGHRFAALHLADQLELFNNQLRSYNRRISELLPQHPDHQIFTSFPAAGRVIAAELLAEIGEDRDRYPAPRCSSPRPVRHRSRSPPGRCNESASAGPATGGSVPRPPAGPTCSNGSTRSPATATWRPRTGAPPTTVPSEPSPPHGCECSGAAGKTAQPTNPPATDPTTDTFPDRATRTPRGCADASQCTPG